jgi:3-deoxy-D-manno-octulosonic-acid transferase
MHLGYTLYNLLLPAARLAARIAAPFKEKIAEGLAGRKDIRRRWLEKSEALDRTKRLLWFHVSSVGEFEQAKPVMSLIAERYGADIEIAITFYSPSGMKYYERFDRSKRIEAVRFVDYLPVDTRGNARFCLDTLVPSGIVYVKFDLWPNLIAEAERRGVRQVLVSGTLSPGSKRLSSIARGFYSDVYSRLDAIAAISDEDAERFRHGFSGNEGPRGTGQPPIEIVTAGDTRFDQVCRRIDTSTVTLPLSLTRETRPFVIAGSTWPRDEEVAIPGFARIHERFPEAGLIVAPHEPTPKRLEEIGTALGREDLHYTLLSAIGDEGTIETPVVVADGVGYLAELYRAGFCAYVGGSFTTGVHNVMEPAVLSLPVFFGPRIDNSYEARMLVEIGAGRIVTSAAEFEDEVGALFADRSIRDERGDKGSLFIRNHCGAAIRCVDLIEKHTKLSHQ